MKLLRRKKMKLFKISFTFETDDTWVNGDLKDMMTVTLNDLSHPGFGIASKLDVTEIEGEE